MNTSIAKRIASGALALGMLCTGFGIAGTTEAHAQDGVYSAGPFATFEICQEDNTFAYHSGYSNVAQISGCYQYADGYWYYDWTE